MERMRDDQLMYDVIQSHITITNFLIRATLGLDTLKTELSICRSELEKQMEALDEQTH